MLVFKSIKNLQLHLSSFSEDATIGFVPTMGALHKGHLSLVKESMQNNYTTVVSIFVNPTQFDKTEDLEKYPRTLDTDIQLLESVSCDIAFAPNAIEIYNNNIKSAPFYFDGLEHQMEGKFRSGHFDGVGTIVKRFFEIVKPTRAYFGEKDFQQLQIIRKLTEKFQIAVNVIGCDIYREEDGLAMSSRNILLSQEQRNDVPFIFKTLKEAKKLFENKNPIEIVEWVHIQFQNHRSLNLEYFQIADELTLESANLKTKGKDYRAFIAVFAGKVRLIDNIRL